MAWKERKFNRLTKLPPLKKPFSNLVCLENDELLYFFPELQLYYLFKHSVKV